MLYFLSQAARCPAQAQPCWGGYRTMPHQHKAHLVAGLQRLASGAGADADQRLAVRANGPVQRVRCALHGTKLAGRSAEPFAPLPTMPSALHYLTAARECEITELEQLLRTSALVQRLGQLIHALQKERGLSSITLASQGQRGVPALAQQTQASDQCITALKAELTLLNLTPQQYPHGARLFTHIAYVLQGLEALALLRLRVTQQRLPLQDCTRAYIHLIAGLLTVVFEAADSATQPAISRLLVAMFYFMQGKELTGQERATGAVAFNSGKTTPSGQQHWLHLIESQARCMQVFSDCAPPPLVQAWQSSHSTHPSIITIERLRRVGCTAPQQQALDPHLGQTWFDACTEYMDVLHGIEMQLAHALHRQCSVHLAQARASLRNAPPPAPPERSDSGLPAFFAAPQPSHHLRSPLQEGYSSALGPSLLDIVQEQAQHLQRMRQELETVRQSLNERKTLERAKGLLMTRQGMSEDEAHKLLRQTAMSQNRRMIDVAEAVLSMAELISSKRVTAL